MEFEIRVLRTPGQYEVWVADNDTAWAQLSYSKGRLTAHDVSTAVIEHARRLGWENFPERIVVVDEQREAIDSPPELWSVLETIFEERERYRKA